MNCPHTIPLEVDLDASVESHRIRVRDLQKQMRRAYQPDIYDEDPYVWARLCELRDAHLEAIDGLLGIDRAA